MGDPYSEHAERFVIPVLLAIKNCYYVISRSFFSNIKMSNTYKTRDIYFASYLVMNKIQIVELVKEEKHFSFFFTSSEELLSLKEEFYSRSARVEPMEYTMAMKQVKSAMYNSQ